MRLAHLPRQGFTRLRAARPRLKPTKNRHPSRTPVKKRKYYLLQNIPSPTIHPPNASHAFAPIGLYPHTRHTPPIKAIKNRHTSRTPVKKKHYLPSPKDLTASIIYPTGNARRCLPLLSRALTTIARSWHFAPRCRWRDHCRCGAHRPWRGHCPACEIRSYSLQKLSAILTHLSTKRTSCACPARALPTSALLSVLSF